MAWLSNLADKAENLLNRLDHNASIVLLQKDEGEENDGNIRGSHAENPYMMNNAIQSEETNVFSHEDELHTMETTVEDGAELINNSSVGLPLVQNTSAIQSSTISETSYLENIDSSSNITTLQCQLTNCIEKNSDLENKLQQTLSLLALTQEETEKHRSKALKILQDKERLVAQIEKTPFSTIDSSENIEYLSKLMKTRDELQKTIDELTERVELLQSDLTTTQKQCSLYMEEAGLARQTLQKEQKIRIAIEEEFVQNKQELHKVYEELKQHIKLLNTKNEQLLLLQKQIDTRSTSSENEELESKFHVLTQILIMKQNTVETLTTERNALRLQLERVESNYAKILKEYNAKPTSSILNIESFDEGKTSSFFTMSPFDEGVTRRVKRAISTLNTFSIRLGVFLRRYPVARVFLLCYTILLQIWVVVILFAYVPSNN